MKLFGQKYLLAFLLIALFALGISVYAEPGEENILLKMNRDLEEWYLNRLSAVQSDPTSKLTEFATDGCSGGLSDAWNGFANVFPEFKQHFNQRPPWESCCVAHDRAYWKGETVNGFDERLLADKALSQCVLDYGTENSKRLSEKFNLSEQQILTQFKLTSTLMYRAVRLGGKPCSYLPWRWGYGWPNCELTSN